MVMLAITILYVVIVLLFNNAVGAILASLIVVPVTILTWYFGARIGLIAGFCYVIINSVLFSRLHATPWLTWIAEAWPGNLVALFMGYLVGNIQREAAERKRIGIKLNSLERFIMIFGMAVKDILDPLIPDEKYYYLAEHLVNLFVADYAYIASWDVRSGKMTLLASTKPLQFPIPNIVLEPEQVAPDSMFLKYGQGLVVGKAANRISVIDLVMSADFSLPAGSVFILPLSFGVYKFGMVVFGFDSHRHFSSEEMIVARLVSSQVTLALWTDVQIKKQLVEANALIRIERALSETEQVGLENVLQLITDATKELIPAAEQAVLHLVNSETRLLVPRAVAGSDISSSKTKINMSIGEGIAGQVIATGNSISIPDIYSDERFIKQLVSVNYHSLSVVPIKKQELVVGTISMASNLTNAFTPDDNRLLEALGVQAAIAIENANLLETTRADLLEMNALYQIGRGLAATLDPDQLMKDTTDLLQRNFGYYIVQILVRDEASGDLVVRYASGYNAAQFLEGNFHLAVGFGIVGHVAEFGEPFMTNSVEDVIFYMNHPLLEDTQSELAVPIKIDGSVVGVLDIQEKAPRQFSPRQLKLTMAIADQLAVALQKARLYEELQSSLRQEKAARMQLIQSERLATVGRLLASVSHELNNPLQAIQNALFLIKEDEKLSKQGQQDLNIILSETQRMASLIQRLRLTYRGTQEEGFKDIYLNQVIEDVNALTATQMRHDGITFSFQPDLELPVVAGIPEQIRQVILNLFINAVEAMPTGGNFTVYTQHLAESDQVLLIFSDTGVGIHPEILPHLFEPFVTNKATGTGLGLTIAYDIIRQHHGEIQAENRSEGGAIFKVLLPVKSEE